MSFLSTDRGYQQYNKTWSKEAVNYVLKLEMSGIVI